MKTLITNQKVLTTALIVISLTIIGINFLIFQGVNKNLDSSLSQLPEVQNKQKASVSKILSDITSKQKLSDSKIRNTELAKIEKSLPYTDEKNHITISFSPKTKLIVAGVTQAKNLTDYREKKFILEQKLYEFGAENLCNLALVWAPPFEIKSELTAVDVHTSNCTY